MKRLPRGRAVPDRDRLDRLLDIWKAELPELDLETEGIVDRIVRLRHDIDRMMNQTVSEFGLDVVEWRVLGALRKSGPPYRRSPGKLSQELGLSSGAMTNRLDRMEERGLVRRLPDPTDRRALHVELTDAGRKAWMDATAAQGRKEAVIASALSEKEKQQLNALLRRLTLEFERRDARERGQKEPRGKEDA